MGEINKLIDSFVHPIARDDPAYWVLDAILHGLNEQDPEQTVRKFVRYDVPKIIEQVLRDHKRKTKRRNTRRYY